MDSSLRIRVLGRVTVQGAVADGAITRRQARELLGLLVAHRDTTLRTGAIVDALWDGDPPATAATIIHGHIRRLRASLGEHVIRHDGEGYRLDLADDAVDLWAVDDALRRGDRHVARRLWRDPLFGPFADRPWALAFAAKMGHLEGIAAQGARSHNGHRAAPVVRLVGRRQELAGVTRAMDRSRLVSVVGLGGVGKSRLALEFVSHPGETFQVDLGASVGSTATRIAGDLGLVTTGEPSWDQRALMSVLAHRHVLLIIDGCEHDLKGASDVIRDLLASCPNVRILATSRSALGIESEIVVPLLPFDDSGDPNGDAVNLLIDRMAVLGVETGPRDRRRLAAICERTSGVALAIELAAVQAIFGDEVREVPGVEQGDLTGTRGPSDVLDVAVAHALARLTDDAARTIRRLARLHHGFDPSLLRELVGPDGSAPGVLYELRATGLIADRTVNTSGRLTLPDPVRAAALKRSDPAALNAVVKALGEVVRPVRFDLGAPVDHTALPGAVAQFTNIDAVLDDLQAAGDVATALRLVGETAEAWGESGRWMHGGAVLRRLVAHTHPIGFEAAARAASPSCSDVPSVAVDPLHWAVAVRGIAAASATYAAMHENVARMKVAANITVARDEPLLQAHLMFHLALGLGYRGNLVATRHYVDRLFDLAAQIHNTYLALVAKYVVALEGLVVGNPSDAAKALGELARHFTDLNALSDAARCHRTAGLAWSTAGMFDNALDELDTAQAPATQSGARGTSATIQSDRIEVHSRLGDLDRSTVVEARDEVLAVGNLRAAGLLGIKLAKFDGNPAILADAALDLLAADRVWAAVAVAELAAMLPRRHPIRRAAPRVVAKLRTQWGSPLRPHEASIVDVLADRAGSTGPEQDLGDEELTTLLRDITLGQVSSRG